MLALLSRYQQRQRIAEHKSGRFDGHFVGQDGDTSPAEYGYSELTPEGDPSSPVTFLVNGMSCTKDEQVERMKTLAKTGRAVLGVHNGTKGAERDLAQSLSDKMNTGHNPAVSTVRHLISQALTTGRKLSLVGHSQGALVCSRALWQVYDQLSEGISPEVARSRLSLVELETLAGAAQSYPPGPRYLHRAIEGDPIVQWAGLASPIKPNALSDSTPVSVDQPSPGSGSLDSVHSFQAFFS
jgi:hypothetical protein